MNKAIFFDRDGVVNYRLAKTYVRTEPEFNFIYDFYEFFKTAKDSDFLAILITNQQGIGKGLMTEKELSTVHKFMQTTLKKVTGNNFDDIYHCPDLAITNSFRRKPNPGMILEACEKWNVDKNLSFMIGDRISDVIAGKRAGITTFLLGNYKNEEVQEADYICKDLYEVKKIIFKNV